MAIDYYRIYAFNENERRFLGNLLIFRNKPLSALNDRAIDQLIKKEFFKDPSEVEIEGDSDIWIYEVPTGYGYEGIMLDKDEDDISAKQAKSILNEKDIFGNGMTWVIDTRKVPYRLIPPSESIAYKMVKRWQ